MLGVIKMLNVQIIKAMQSTKSSEKSFEWPEIALVGQMFSDHIYPIPFWIAVYEDVN